MHGSAPEFAEPAAEEPRHDALDEETHAPVDVRAAAHGARVPRERRVPKPRQDAAAVSRFVEADGREVPRELQVLLLVVLEPLGDRAAHGVRHMRVQVLVAALACAQINQCVGCRDK